MNWYWFFYWFSVADKLHATFVTLSIITGILFVIFFFIWLFTEKIDGDFDSRTEYNQDKMSDNPAIYKRFMWWFRAWLVFMMSFIVLSVAVPNKKDMLLILSGGAIGEFVTSNEDAKELPADVVKFLRAEITSATEELADDAKKEVKDALNIGDKLEDLTKEELIKRLKGEEKLEDLTKEELIKRVQEKESSQ